MRRAHRRSLRFVAEFAKCHAEVRGERLLLAVFWKLFAISLCSNCALSLLLEGLTECNKNDAGINPQITITEAWRVPKCEKIVQKCLGRFGGSGALVGFRTSKK